MTTAFDPNKYGNPCAKKQKTDALPSESTDDAAQRNTSNTNNAEQSVVGTPTNSQGHTLPSNDPTTAVKSEVTEPPIASTTSVKNGERAAGPATSGVIIIPGFDPNKYGNPVRRMHKPDQAVSVPANAEAMSIVNTASSPLGKSERPVSEINSSRAEKKMLPAPSAAAKRENPSPSSSSPSTRLDGGSSDGASSATVMQSDHLPEKAAALATNRGLQNEMIGRRSHPRSVEKNQHSRNTRRPRETEEALKARLESLQAAELRKIGQHVRNRGCVGVETTSLKDLYLARQPVAKNVTIQTAEWEVAPTSDTANVPASAIDYGAGGIPNQSNVDVEDSTVARGKTNGTVDVLTNPHASVPFTEQNPEIAGAPLSNGRSQRRRFGSTSSRRLNKKVRSSSRPSRWATTAELKPIHARIETDSNAQGSDVASDAEIESNDSTKPMHHGKLFRKNPPALPDPPLANPWDGKFQPPPVDWNDRPRFNNNSPVFKNGFNTWTTTTAHLAVSPHNGVPFVQIPYERLQNPDLHADGLGLVEPFYTINQTNASNYGYSVEINEITKDAKPLRPEDVTDWGKLDERNQENLEHKNEVTAQLVENWNAHQRRFKAENQIRHREDSALQRYLSDVYRPIHNVHAPKVNIYLRPAVRTDIGQMMELYNWYVENSPRTSELKPITHQNMISRWEDSNSAKLPSLVAVTRVHRNAEVIVGYASAAEITNAAWAERISTEVEVYVHHEWLHKGVGKCLMDKLMEATDRGHLARRGYEFTCDPTIRHHYEAGGGRDLHLLIFILRHYKHPAPRDPNSPEHDYNKWLKKWLEGEWGFEEQGCLKGAGAKNSRFVNHSYLCRETKWQPCEGRIPDYFPSPA